MNVDIVLKATKVDGVYTDDPLQGPDGAALQGADVRRGDRQEPEGHGRDGAHAVPRPETADQGVFSIFMPGALKRVVLGEDEGTLVHC